MRRFYATAALSATLTLLAPCAFGASLTAATDAPDPKAGHKGAGSSVEAHDWKASPPRCPVAERAVPLDGFL